MADCAQTTEYISPSEYILCLGVNRVNRVATRWAKWPKVGSLNGPFKAGYLKNGPFQVGYF